MPDGTNAVLIAVRKSCWRLDRPGLRGALAIVFAYATAACTDVGDSSAIPDDAANNSLMDAAAPGIEEGGQDGGTQDVTTGFQDAGGQDASSQDTTTQQDTETQEAGTLDAGADAGANDTGIDSTVVTDATADTSTGAIDSAADSTIMDAGIDTGSVDAGADTTAPDGNITDSRPADSPAGDGAGDAVIQDSGGSDASDGGGLVPCITAGQTNCAQCSGNTNGVCTTEEAYFVQKDIAAGKVTAAGPIDVIATPFTNCYSCLVNNSAINGLGTTGVECGDLAATFVNASGATVSGPATCESLIECIAGTTGNHCAGGEIVGNNPAVGNDTFCYCGSGGYGAATPNGPAACQSAAASALNGNCLAQELAGFASTVPATNFSAFGSSALPSGMANQMIESARDTHTTKHCTTLCGF